MVGVTMSNDNSHNVATLESSNQCITVGIQFWTRVNDNNILGSQDVSTSAVVREL